MKKYFYFAAVAIIATLSTGCFATKGTAPDPKGTAPDPKGPIEITQPLSGKEYRSNSEYWRSVQFGKSDDMSMARKVAMQSARQELAASIVADVNSIMEIYGQNHSEKAKSMYEELGTTTVKQSLRDVEVVGEKCFLYEDGTYQYHICLQISKLQVMKELEDKLAQEAKLNLEFDRERFRKVRDAEFQKFAEER